MSSKQPDAGNGRADDPVSSELNRQHLCERPEPLERPRTVLLLESLSCLAKIVDLDTLWTTVVGRLKWLLDFERLDVALLHEDGCTYRLQTLFETRRNVPLTLSERIPLEQGLAGLLISRNEACRVFTLNLETPLPTVIVDEWLEGGSLPSVMGILLEAHGEKLGVLLLGTTVSGGYGHADVEIVSTFATHLSLVLQRLEQTRKMQQTTAALKQEIFERKQAEAALREWEQRFNLATNAAELGVFEWDVQTDHAYWENHRMYDIFGQSLADGTISKAQFVNGVLHPDERAAFEQALQDAMQLGDRFYLVCRIRRRDDQWRWIEFNGRFSYAPDGTPLRLLSVIGDITDRKQAELVLVEQKRLLELTASGHPLDECLSSLCASMSRLNPRVRACILLTDAHRLTFPRSITPDFPPSFGQGLKDAPINELAIGTCGTAVYCGQPVTCRDIANDHRWSKGWRDLCVAHGILACHSAPVLGVDGLPLGSLMLCFDEARMPTDWEYQLSDFGTHIASIVFERDCSSLALRESEELKQRILESNNDCIKVLTLNGEILYISQGGLCLLEIDDPTSVLNMDWVNFWQGENYENAKAAISRATSGDIGQFQGYLLTMKGKPKWWDSVISPIRDESGKVVQLVAISRDITKQKQAEAEREQLLQREQTARAEAEAANRIKDEFLAVLSHELR